MTQSTPASPLPAGGLLAANLFCMASMLIWAAGLPAAEWLIDVVAPVPLTAMRMSLAALSLLPLWLMLEGPGALRSVVWGRALWVGATLGGGAIFLVIGQAMTDPVTVAVISAGLPVVGIAIELIADRRPLTVALILGVVLSLAGALVALGRGIGGLDIGLGAAACLVSVVTFALASRLTVTSFPGLSPLGRTSVTLTGAAIATTATALAHAGLTGAGPDWRALGAAEWSALAVYSVGALGLSQLLWILSVGRIGIGQASLHINAAPFYVMIFTVMLGGAWQWTQVLGAAIVALGVMVAQGLIPLRPSAAPRTP
ncbi:DMT family transporter [Aliigemmobacter aestuarii]|uniref:DMT family transporter n=1 Tax=Aliigemmobacter aestuarii TaxID=1445661 RepID=A0A4S3MQX5_9RHOB|nr:DMT family transporter [Gemmobacter aestuarii]THD84423.1 DMT family transporter [Gemmobacter aestuarii]